MSDDRLKRALRTVGDGYIRDNPADFEKFREGVRKRSRRRGFRFGSTVVTATAIALVAVLAVVRGPVPENDRRTQDVARSVGLEVVANIQLPSASNEIAGIDRSAVLALEDPAALVRVDPESEEPAWETELPAAPVDVLQGASAAWVSMPDVSQIARIDVGTGEPRFYDLAPFTAPTRMHVGAHALRAAVDEGIIRMSYASRRPELLYSGEVHDVAMGNTAFWVLRTDGVVEAIDPDSGKDAGLLSTTLGPGGEITFLREKLWMGLPHAPHLYRLTEATGEVEGVTQLPGDYVDVDAGVDGLWVLTSSDQGGAVTELDPVTGELLERTYVFDSTPLDLSHDEAGIWVSLANGSVVLLGLAP